MATHNEPARALEFLLSEASGTRSRENVTLAASQGALDPGTVLGKITKGAGSFAHVAGGTGNSTCGTITVGSNSKVGVYQLIFTAATKANIEDPDGVLLGVVTLGSEFTGGGLTFTMTAGATPHVANDRATITVAAGSGAYAVYDNTAANGTEIAAAVLGYPADNSASTQSVTVIARDAEVKADFLDWGANDANGITAGKADLASVGIIVRTA